MLPTVLMPIVSLLFKKGLNIVASAVDNGGDKVTELIAKKTGLKLTGKTDLSPTEIAKLKELELDPKFQIDLERLRLDGLKEENRHEETYLADIGDARKRQIAVESISGKRDLNLYAIAWTVIIGFFILCGVLMLYEMPAGSNEVVFMLFGSISSGFGMVLSYFFGSSKSSRDKTYLMAKNKKEE